MEFVAILDLAFALGIEAVPEPARGLFTQAAMMLSKLEVQFGSVEPFVIQAAEPTSPG